MTDNYSFSIAPLPELVKQWREQAPRCRDGGIAREDWLMTRAAQWGADQELEACCEWLDGVGDLKPQLRAARRPEPPSLKEQSLKHLEVMERDGYYLPEILQDLRRALEQLND